MMMRIKLSTSTQLKTLEAGEYEIGFKVTDSNSIKTLMELLSLRLYSQSR